MTTAAEARKRFRYIPALDGMRGFWVVFGPLLYHARPESVPGGPEILPGGILAVDLFFVLSSYLIFSIALNEWENTGRLDLVAYAGRRARRLLPALLTALALLTAYLVVVGDPEIVPRWTGAIVSTLTYSANWHEIVGGVSYFEQFDDPSPLKHVWSFAIEEQFYLFAPLFLIAGMRWFGRRGREVLLVVSLLGAVASAVWMAVLHEPGTDPSRVYYGTDTRAQALFVGIAMALLVRIFGEPRSVRVRNAFAVAAYGATAVFAWMVLTVDQNADWMFERFGFLMAAVLAAVILFGLSREVTWSPLQWAFESRPFRYVGRISYGLYLYHWPVYLLLTQERAGRVFGVERVAGVPLLLFHLAITFAVSVVSFHLIETPFMRRSWPVVRRRVTLASGAFAGSVAVVVILAGLLAANATRPVRLEQVLVPVAAPASVSAGGSFATGGSVPDPGGGGALAGIPAAGDDGSAAGLPAGTPADGPTAGDAVARSAAEGSDSRDDPVRVLVVGDSVSAQIGWALYYWSQDHPGRIVVFNESHLGCPVGRWGLKRVPEGDFGEVGAVCSEWAEPVDPTTVADSEVVSWRTAVDVFDPDVVVAHVSPWDATDRIVPGVVEDWTSVGDPVYDAWLADEYTAAAEILTSRGATLHWLLTPYLRRLVPDDHEARIDGLNAIAAATADRLADRDIRLVDYASFFGPVGGERDRVLRDDGVHLSETGFDEIAPWLVGRLGLS